MTATLLTIQVALTVVGVVIASVWAVRRLGTGAAILWAGAAVFIVSQILRQPALGLLTLSGAGAGVLTTAAIVSSGVFEEGTRWAALRWVLVRRRRAEDGVVMGLGHGGVEAVLLIGLSGLASIALVLGGERALEIVAEQGDATAVEAVSAQIAALDEISPFTVIAALFERVAAIAAHIAMTLLVLRSVCTRELVWLGVAMGFHIALNAVAVGLLGVAGVLGAMIGLAVFAVAAIRIIRAALADRATWFPAPSEP